MSNLKVNSQIKANQVILIDSDGQNIGKISLFLARQKAEEQQLDLILVDDQKVPICKIADYGKVKYDLSKKKHKTQSHKSIMKEIRFGINISDHDLEIKNSKVHKFLAKGHKVRYVLQRKGSARTFPKDRAVALYDRAIEEFKEGFIITSSAFNGSQITSTISCK